MQFYALLNAVINHK